jgi:DNA-binding CsgD family transcriptional regulator
VATLAVVTPPPVTDPYASRERHHNEGHGRRLTAAFEALEAYPVLVESRNRILRLFEDGEPGSADLISAIESDVALTVTVVRLANRVEGPQQGRVDSAVTGLEVLTPRTVHAIATRARTFDFFERTAVWQGIPERFRLHAVATQRAADRLAREIGYEHRDRLMVTSLLHDIGKLVLIHAYPGYPSQVHGEARTPEERLQRERRELGVDHALVGGVLARIRLADMLAHYVLGGVVAPAEMLAAARTVGMSPAGLRTVMYELPLPTTGGRPRQVDPCPMSAREIDVLRRLARGMVYKQIAGELNLSTSTVRTHLHNVYGKLGAMDRAQAVLMATERGWI